jgi:hypothetical protein
MFWKTLSAAIALLDLTSAAQAHTSENVLFTCEGELIKFQGNDGKNYRRRRYSRHAIGIRSAFSTVPRLRGGRRPIYLVFFVHHLLLGFCSLPKHDHRID